MKLYVSCDCPDTDFMVRITDVDETGRSIKYLEPGRIYDITIRTTKISNTFLPGHSLRLTVTSSGKNFIFPNSNTEDGFDSTCVRRAHVTVHRGGETSSAVVMMREKK